jgi:hypothetical protein
VFARPGHDTKRPTRRFTTTLTPAWHRHKEEGFRTILLTLRKRTHYLESSIGIQWQMGIRGGHGYYAQLFTLLRAAVYTVEEPSCRGKPKDAH